MNTDAGTCHEPFALLYRYNHNNSVDVVLWRVWWFPWSWFPSWIDGVHVIDASWHVRLSPLACTFSLAHGGGRTPQKVHHHQQGSRRYLVHIAFHPED